MTSPSTVHTRLSERQNTPRSIELLAAQRYLYSKAKAIQIWYTLVSVPAVVVWTLLAAWKPELKVYAAIWSGALITLDILWLTPWQTRLKREAAKTQEQFDCDVLQLPWQNLKAGAQPTNESIIKYSRVFNEKHSRDPKALEWLKDWYPVEADALPILVGRIMCQRINCWWDGTLRRRYSVLMLSGSLVLLVVLVLIGLLAGTTLVDLLLTLATVMPLIAFGFRQYRDNADAADTADRLRDHATELWSSALQGTSSPAELTLSSRELQNEIYDSRRRNSLVYDWVYNRSRNQQESDMKAIAKSLVDEALNSPAMKATP